MNYISKSHGFFIDTTDIKKFLGIPSLFEIYKKEGSENYETDDSENLEYHRYKDEDDRGEKEPSLEIIYPKRTKPRKYKYYDDDHDRDSSDRRYKYRDGEHTCEHHSRRNKEIDRVKFVEKPDESRNKENKKLITPELKDHIEEERRETLKKLKKKDYVTGILIALPRFNEGSEKNNEFYILKDNMKKYFKTIDKESRDKDE